MKKDDFEQWRDSVATQAVFKAMKTMAVHIRSQWIHAAWVSGDLSPELLMESRSKCENLEDITSWTYEDIEEYLDEQPERNKSD